MLDLIHGEHLWLIVWVFVLLLVLSFWRYVRKKKNRKRFKILEINRQLFSRLPGRFWEVSRATIICLAFLIGSLALLGIVLNQTKVYPERQGAYICFILDITYSMQASLSRHSQITRMEAMLEALEDVFEILEEEKEQKNRIIIVAFGWGAWRLTQYPVNDFRLLRREVLSRINRWASLEHGREGSNLGAALIEGVLSFPEDKPGAEPRKKVLLVITDGEPYGDLTEIQKQIAGAVAKYGRLTAISFYLVGIGNPEEEIVIPKYDHLGNIVGEELDSSGQPIATRSDFRFLQEIAEKTGGVFVPAVSGSVGGLKKDLRKTIAQARETGKMLKEPVVTDLTFYSVVLYLLLVLLIFLKYRN